MFLDIIFAFLAGGLGGVMVHIAISWTLRRSLYNLEVDVADLQERHLRAVRKSAAKERWDGEEQLDLNIEKLAQRAPKTKGWTKWPSSAHSESSSAAPPNQS